MTDDSNVPMSVANFQRKYARGFILFVLGLVVSWVVADHYHGQTSSEHRAMLLDNVLFEMELYESHQQYRPYKDTSAFSTAGRPFAPLLTLSLERLYQNLHLFPATDSITATDRLSDRVAGCLLKIRFFNDLISWRNDLFVRKPEEVREMNPTVFEVYHSSVKPDVISLREYLTQNRSILIE